MGTDDVERWFGEYLAAYAACGRGETGTEALLAYYGDPLLITTDGGYFPLAGGPRIVAGVGPQIEAMRQAGYHHTEVLDFTITPINAKSALYRGTFSWQRADGTEFNRPTATYLITDGPAGRRISVLAVHGA